MKKFWLACTMVIAMGISSCVDSDKDLYQGEPETERNISDFSTTKAVQTEIDYAITDAKVPFFIYDRNPLITTDDTPSVKLDKSIKPLDGGRTDVNGKFSGEFNLPAYVSDVYIVSTAFNAPVLLEGKVDNGTLKVVNEVEEEVVEEGENEGGDEISVTRASYSNSSRYDKSRFKSLGWRTALGTYNSRTGKINYAYTKEEAESDAKKGATLTLTTEEITNLHNTVYSVLNRMGTCPKEFRTTADLETKDDNTAVVLTAIGGQTCWNNSLGYYYYPKNKKLTSLSEVKVFTIFPNTQTTWNQGNLQSYPQGLEEGTAVKLKFFGEKGEAKEGTNFPKDYKIGFVLACNAWNYYFTGYSSYVDTGNKYYASSTTGLSTKGGQNLKVHTAMFKEKETDNIAIAFEDFRDDQNFTDVIFALKASPEIDVPQVVDPDLNTTIEKTGVYAFEDEWPAAKDYDMNDVVAQYTYKKTFNVDNQIVKESFAFKTFQNWAVFNNGLAFALENAGTAVPVDSIKETENQNFVETHFTHEGGNVTILSDNVKNKMNAEYKVIYDYGKNSKKLKETVVNPFIFRESKDGMRREIHCPLQRPTSKVDISFFGQQDDCSVPERGIYYVSNQKNIYPFAFFLNNATVEDIAPLLDINNEKKAISELYPNFIDWAKHGTHADWYKK